MHHHCAGKTQSDRGATHHPAPPHPGAQRPSTLVTIENFASFLLVPLDAAETNQDEFVYTAP